MPTKNHAKTHEYTATIRWTGNTGDGTSSYKSYSRNWQLVTAGKAPVSCSNDPVLGGDPEKHNPEDMLIAAVSSCHMLWYLHLCALAGVNVISYEDAPLAIGELESSGAGRFKSITLHPNITISAKSDHQKAMALHAQVHQYCFIARSINFPVEIEPEISCA